MAKRQNFVVGSTNSNTETQTVDQLNRAWDKYQILESGTLDGVFNAVSDYSNDSSNEIANAIQSITGSQPTGNSQSELAGALSQMRSEIETKSLTFKGYIGTSAPDTSVYTVMEGNIWINSATMPTSFPVAASSIKEWNGSAWVNYGSTYTPADFDFFRNLTDNEGYYWFGGVWTVMSTDMSTTYFTLNQSTGKWEIKSSVNLPGAPTTTTPSAGDNSTKIATTAFVLANSYQPSLFDFKWSDHELDDMSWVRADTFSWQPGTTYSNAYQHLVDDIDGKTLQSETIAGTTVEFYLADDGHKICPAVQEANVLLIAVATGIAWYYILDTTNQRFKLPYTQFGFTGLRSTVGSYVEPGLPNITGTAPTTAGVYESVYDSNTGALYCTDGWSGKFSGGNGSTNASGLMNLDASQSNSIYGNSTTVQPPATQMYLYAFVGGFSQSAVQNTAGLNAELFNNKADTDLNNTPMATADYVVEWQTPTSQNNYTWYRKYKSGWVEQGGLSAGGSYQTIQLPVEMADVNYSVTLTDKRNSNTRDGNENCQVLFPSCTETSLYLFVNSNCTCYWEVKGVAA